MHKMSSLFAAVLLSVASTAAFADPVTPTYTSFGPLAGATYGGSGIPNNPSAVSNLAGNLTLGLVAHQRYQGAKLATDGAGTYYADPGFAKPAGSSLFGALWNFGYYLNDSDNNLLDEGRSYKLYYEFNPGVAADTTTMGVFDLTPLLANRQNFQDSQNLAFNFLSAGIPGIVTPPGGSFDPYATGIYSFALVAFDSAGAEIGRSAINVDVPEPGILALMGLGLAGIGAARRRKLAK